MASSSPPADQGLPKQPTNLQPALIMSQRAAGQTDAGTLSPRLGLTLPVSSLQPRRLATGKAKQPTRSDAKRRSHTAAAVPPCHIDLMENPSPPPADQGLQKQETTYLEPTVIMMRLSPAQTERWDRRYRRNNDDPRLDRFGRRLRRMTDYSYPYTPPRCCLDYDFGEPTVVIPKLQGEDVPDYVVHLVYPPLPPSTCHDSEQQLPLQDGATKVVCLSNMISPSKHRLLIEDDDFYDRFSDDVEVQACEFGKIVKIVVPRSSNAGVVGKVFFHYVCLDAANACKIRMDGGGWLKGGDEQIVARFYPEDKFAAGDYGSAVTPLSCL